MILPHPVPHWMLPAGDSDGYEFWIIRFVHFRLDPSNKVGD